MRQKTHEPAYEKKSLKKPTLIDVGKAAGVSVATVSLALRNNARIPESTKDRIRRIAAQLGYQRDPMIAKLMTQLRRHRNVLCKGMIAAIATPSIHSCYTQRLVEAVRRRAAELGYNIVVESVARTRAKQRSMESALIHRGIEAVLLLPSDFPVDLTHALNWNRYTIVSAGYNPVQPNVHRVTSNWFNTVKLCGAKLRSRGCSKIGYVFGINYEFLSGHMLTGALSLEVSWNRNSVIPPYFYRPLLGSYCSEFHCQKFIDFLTTNRRHPTTGIEIKPLAEGLLPWYAEYEPDVLVFDREETAEEAACLFLGRSIKPPLIATTSRSAIGALPGVCLPAEKVGIAATDLLDHLVRHGETGIPENHSSIAFEGRWLEAN